MRKIRASEKKIPQKEAFDGLDYFIKVSAHIAKNEKDYELSMAIQKFEKNIDTEVIIRETKMGKEKDRAGDNLDSDDGTHMDGNHDKGNPQEDNTMN